MIYGGDVAPVNTSLVPNYATITPFLKDKPWNSVNGQMYGIPHGWGANLLMYNIGVVHDAPDSWGAVFDDASKYKGKVTAYDSPIYIADAALYLSKTKPDLGIKDPVLADVRTTRRRRRPAQVAAREHQRVLVGLHQGGPGLRIGHVRDRHDVAGDRQHHRHRQQGAGQHRAPEGGRHGLVGHLDDRREGRPS